MAGDRDDRDSTAPGFIQTDLYGHSFEAQLPDSLTKGSRRRAPALSRRELLKRAGVAGAAAAVPLGLPEAVYGATGAAEATQAAPAASAAASPETFETLTAAQFDVLEAIAARLIPSDDNGPGATEARAAHFIDRALGGPLVAFRDTYQFGLAAVDEYARSSKSAPFTELSAPAQDAVLRDIENNVPTDECGPRSSAFFNLVRAHTIQGMFCDPYHGGNAGLVGWDLIAYPGVRLVATPDDQQMDRLPTPNHKSAYDYPMFTKRRPGQ